LWSDALRDGFTGFREAGNDATLDGVFLEGEALFGLCWLLIELLLTLKAFQHLSPAPK
jgi:hypothetical protein